MKKEKATPAGALTGEIVSAPLVSTNVMGNLDTETWFARLSDDEKVTIKKEDKELANLYQQVGRSRLAAAAHLLNVYKILGPLKVFERYIKRFNLKRTNAYRAIRAYQNVQHLPQTLLAVAMTRNMALMGETKEEPYGVYTDAVKRLPPPRNVNDEGKAAEYLDMLEAKRRELKPRKRGRRLRPTTIPMGSGDLMQRAYRIIDRLYRHLPDDWSKSKRTEWLRTLCGMILRLSGLEEDQTIPLIAPPPDFIAVRGRPRSRSTVN